MEKDLINNESRDLLDLHLLLVLEWIVKNTNEPSGLLSRTKCYKQKCTRKGGKMSHTLTIYNKTPKVLSASQRK